MCPLGFLVMVVSFVGFFVFKACGENIIGEEHCQLLSSVEETWPVIMFCLNALFWVIIKAVLLCSTFQQHAIIVFVKAVLLDMFYGKQKLTQLSVVACPMSLYHPLRERLALCGWLSSVRAVLLPHGR